MKQQLLWGLLFASVAIPLAGAPREWKEDLSKTTGEPPLPVDWMINPVKLSKDFDPVKHEVSLKKETDGTPYLALSGGSTTIVHYFNNNFIPVKGGKDSFEISFEAKGPGSGVSAGCYLFSNKQWLRTFSTNQWGLKKNEWKKYTMNLPIPEFWKEKKITEVRPLIICGQKDNIDFRNLSWKIISNTEKPAGSK